MEYRVKKWDSDEPPDESSLKERMESEGFSVYRWSDAPGAVYPTHSHGNNQSHWIIKGSIEFVINGDETFTLEAGDRDFMPAGTDHSARVVSEAPAVYLIGERE
jgi:quercetin dioxygenase-like cupin family protein